MSAYPSTPSEGFLLAAPLSAGFLRAPVDRRSRAIEPRLILAFALIAAMVLGIAATLGAVSWRAREQRRYIRSNYSQRRRNLLGFWRRR
ncbi:hypothetical protein AB2M62_02720 [Sphingomonas sp. MMS12-HWE2-04]|uniref:hypothetical protein n=1 Tax=Sphingomonas sp. MMS12-HWE2-04 TaxID=3234199 RepID=UPI00385078A8